MPLLYKRRYESDSLVDPLDRRDGLSTYKCTAQKGEGDSRHRLLPGELSVWLEREDLDTCRNR